LPPDHLAFLAPVPVFVAGISTGPITIQVQNSANGPATFPTAITVNLGSSATGDFNFALSSGGPSVTSFSLPAGTSNGVVYFTGYKAESPNLTATALAAITTPTVTLGITVSPALYSKLQVLLPVQTPDPGKPISDPQGRIGTPNSVSAGSFVTATVNAVDAFFNLINTISNSVTFTTSDVAAPPQGNATLASGTANHSDVFITGPSQQTLTARDLTSGFTGTSDPVSVLPGINSKVLNVVHAAPNLSTVVAGQKGIVVMTFTLTVQSGTNPIILNSLTLNAQDQLGNGIALNSAFQDLVLTGGPQPVTFIAGGTSSALFAGPITVFSVASLPLTLTADISAAPSAKTAQLSLKANGISAQDAIIGTAVSFSSFGDPTGFPMNSSVMLFTASDVASTYGNYPNPFHAGSQSTTVEFYLSSSFTVSLVVYDVTGNRVVTLADHQNLGPGLQRIMWDGRNGMGLLVVNGIYYAQLDVNGSKYLTKVAVSK
jgi:hypothetical protein